VAAGLTPIALGPTPAAVCASRLLLRGDRDQATYGRVSRYGLVAFGSSLDSVGVLGRNAGEIARVSLSWRGMTRWMQHPANCR